MSKESSVTFCGSYRPARPASARSAASRSEYDASRFLRGDHVSASPNTSRRRLVSQPCSAGQSTGQKANVCAIRPLEDELRGMPLVPIPATLATPLELQFAEVCGILGDQVPRLPQDVAPCHHGGRCCWRWLARAALEEIAGTTMRHLAFPQVVHEMRAELAASRQERTSAEAEKIRADQAEESLEECGRAYKAAMAELSELRGVQREMDRVLQENIDLQASNGRLAAVQQAASQELVQIKEEQRVAMEKDLESTREKLAELEKDTAQGDTLGLSMRFESYEKSLEDERNERKILHDKLLIEELAVRKLRREMAKARAKHPDLRAKASIPKTIGRR